MSTNKKHLRGKDGGLGFSRGREATESSPIFMGVMGGSVEVALAMEYGRWSGHLQLPLSQNPKGWEISQSALLYGSPGLRYNSPPSLILHHITKN